MKESEKEKLFEILDMIVRANQSIYHIAYLDKNDFIQVESEYISDKLCEIFDVLN